MMPAAALSPLTRHRRSSILGGAELQLVFDDCVLDPDRRELCRGPARIAAGPKVFDLLLYLVQNRQRVVSKDEVLDVVWAGRIVSESTLASHINAVRKAIGDSGEEQRLLRTVARRGFRFVGDIREIPSSEPAHITAKTNSDNSGEALTLPSKPSLAVLPFQNMTGDPKQDYFVDGMVEEIITALSRIRWLFVIARNSSFTYKGRAIDVKQIGHELGVRYVLEGSVRKVGNRVRIAGQLIDAITGTHLWADRFDDSLEDVFELQDKVASSVAGVIEPALQAAETARSVNRPTADMTAYDLYLRAYTMYLSSAKQIPGALGLLEQALARDPDYGLALAWAAICCRRMLVDGSSEDREADSLKSVAFARRALEVAGDDPAVLANAAQALAHSYEDLGAMIALVDRALALNPSYARGWHISGFLRVRAGKLDTAIEHAETALRLSPRARVGMTYSLLGRALFLSRRFHEAVPKLLLAIQDEPNYPQPYRTLAACYAHMDRLDDAQKVVARLRSITSLVIDENARYLRHPEHRELYLSGLRLAAGETTA
jgi:TolB-like protein/Flp pilus assembly protein TadD